MVFDLFEGCLADFVTLGRNLEIDIPADQSSDRRVGGRSLDIRVGNVVLYRPQVDMRQRRLPEAGDDSRNTGHLVRKVPIQNDIADRRTFIRFHQPQTAVSLSRVEWQEADVGERILVQKDGQLGGFVEGALVLVPVDGGRHGVVCEIPAHRRGVLDHIERERVERFELERV